MAGFGLCNHELKAVMRMKYWSNRYAKFKAAWKDAESAEGLNP